MLPVRVGAHCSLHFVSRLVGISDRESSLLPSSHQIEFDYQFRSLPQDLPPSILARVLPSAFSRADLKTIPYILPRKSYIPGEWYYEINTAALSDVGGYGLDGPLDRMFTQAGPESALTVPLPLNVTGFAANCVDVYSGCFNVLNLLNVTMEFNGTESDLLLDEDSRTSVEFSSLANDTDPEASLTLVVKEEGSGRNRLVRWRRLYARESGISALNITQQTQGHPCECVGTSTGEGYSAATDALYCRARPIPCPVVVAGADSPCLSGTSLSGCASEDVVIYTANAALSVPNILPLCSLEATSVGLNLSVTSGGYLTVRNHFVVDALSASVDVSGGLDVLGSVQVGSLNLPRVPAQLTLGGTGFLSSSRFDITPNSALVVGSGAVVVLPGPRTAEQAGITCVTCNQQYTEPSCVVRNPQCVDAFGMAPVEHAAGQYWANCLPCACIGGPDGCSTQRAPFVYGKSWCFIDSPSRQSGCIGSDGVMILESPLRLLIVLLTVLPSRFPIHRRSRT